MEMFLCSATLYQGFNSIVSIIISHYSDSFTLTTHLFQWWLKLPWQPGGGCGTLGARRFLLFVAPGLAEREELPALGGVSPPGVSAGRVMLYHGWLAVTVAGTTPASSSSASLPSQPSSASSSSNGLAGTGGCSGGGVLGLELPPLGEEREPALGGVACPAGGGAGAFFFLGSDCTRASQGGSFGLGVPVDKLVGETHTRTHIHTNKQMETQRCEKGSQRESWHEGSKGKILQGLSIDTFVMIDSSRYENM